MQNKPRINLGTIFYSKDFINRMKEAAGISLESGLKTGFNVYFDLKNGFIEGVSEIMIGSQESILDAYPNLDDITEDAPLIRAHFIHYHGELIQPSPEDFGIYSKIRERWHRQKIHIRPLLLLGAKKAETIDLRIMQKKERKGHPLPSTFSGKSFSNTQEMICGLRREYSYQVFKNYYEIGKGYDSTLRDNLKILERRLFDYSM
ncbi:hypothetical protein HZC32_03695 [Candidatus Woesearchaeota archaeon]|nr:hypothetical protein [Candidatus Woesearchaeota archaeon]